MRKKTVKSETISVDAEGQKFRFSKFITRFITRKNLIVGMLVVALIIGGVLFVVHRYNASRTCKQRATKSCEILKQAMYQLDPAALSDLSTNVDKIKLVGSYQKNPNLLYVVTVYYINLNDASRSRQYLDLLKKTYDPKKGYDPILTGPPAYAKPPQALEQNVVFLEKLNKNLKENFGGVSQQQ